MTTGVDRASPLVHAVALSHRFGSQTALTDIDLRVDTGSFTGIVGPSGAGKTTLLRILLGTLRPTAGRVEHRPGLRIGYVPQLEAVDWNFPVTTGEVVLMGRAPSHRWPWTSRADRLVAAAMLERLGLPGLEQRHIRELSGGQQQRVFVARALVQGAQLVALDEPTAGLDVATRHELLHLLGDLHGAGDLAIVLTTHDLNGLAAHLPHLICLNEKVIASGCPSDVLTSEVLAATFDAPMDVLVHGGLPVVVDAHGTDPSHRHHPPLTAPHATATAPAPAATDGPTQ